MNEKDKKQKLYDMYNATSTDDGTGNDEIETYENWIERQLLSRIEKIEQLDLHNAGNQRELLIGALKQYDKVKYEWSKLTYEDYVNKYHPNL